MTISDLSWQEALKQNLQLSKYLWVITCKGRVEGVFGLAEVNTEVGVPWIMTAKKLHRRLYQMTEQAKEIVAGMLEIYPMLVNYTCTLSKRESKWLASLGFMTHAEPTYLPGASVPLNLCEMARGH